MFAIVSEPDEMIFRVARALGGHHLDELMSFYDTDSVLIRPDGSEARGIDAIRTEYSSYIDRVVSMDAKVHSSHVAGDIAVVKGEFEIRISRRNGQEVLIQGHPVEVLRRQKQGNWLYLIDDGGT